MRYLHLVLSIAVLCACSSQGNKSAHYFRIYEDDGITVAETIGGPEYSESLFRFEPILTLKQDPEREESMLYRPNRFVMGPDGYFYVLDRGNRRIAVFNSEGDYERSFGRQGGGPGEFSNITFLQRIEEDVLTIIDWNIQRATRYRINGELIETVSVSSGGRLNKLYQVNGDRLI